MEFVARSGPAPELPGSDQTKDPTKLSRIGVTAPVTYSASSGNSLATVPAATPAAAGVASPVVPSVAGGFEPSSRILQSFNLPSVIESRGGNSGGNSGLSLSQISDRQEARFRQYIDPLIDKQLDSLESTEILDRAIADSGQAFEGVEGQVSRQTSRRGLRLTPSQLKAFRRHANIGQATGTINTISNARIAQEERNTAVAANLSNMGNGLSGIGMQGLGLSAQRDANRRNANAQQSSNYTNSLIGTGAGLATAALMFL